MSVTILDACCLINLYATDLFPQILETMGGSWRVVRPALAETIFMREFSEERGEQRTRVDLIAAVDQGLLSVVDAASDEELASFVQLAQQVDDAEALALAIAKHHRYRLATDDRKARRIARQIGVKIVTTPELLYAWATAGSVEAIEIGKVLAKIETRARLTPAPRSPRFNWWQEHGQ